MKEIKNVLLCGLGAVGSIYARKISKYECSNLKILVDKKRYDKYIKSPKNFNGEELSFNYVLPQNKYFKADLIIISTKYNALKEVVQNIQNFVGDKTIILSLLNGVTSEEIIGERYGFEHILLSYFIGHSAMREGNKITHDGIGKIIFGMSDKFGSQEDVQIVKEFFDKSNIDYEIPEDMYRSLWLKYMLNVASNQPSAILNMTFGQMQPNEKFMAFLKNVINEVIPLAQKEGVKNTDTMLDEALMAFSGMTPEGKTSMLQDIEAGRKTEVEMFAGHIIKLGEKYNIPTPYNKIMKEMIDIIENNN